MTGVTAGAMGFIGAIELIAGLRLAAFFLAGFFFAALRAGFFFAAFLEDFFFEDFFFEDFFFEDFFFATRFLEDFFFAVFFLAEDFFFEASAGQADAGQTSFETLGGNIQLLTSEERKFRYYNLSLGYNFLPGEVFLGRGHAMTSAFYMLGGMGAVKFEGDQRFAVNFGAGFRVLPTDWLAVRIEAQDIVFKSDFLGTNRLRNNLAAYLGASVYF